MLLAGSVLLTLAGLGLGAAALGAALERFMSARDMHGRVIERIAERAASCAVADFALEDALGRLAARAGVDRPTMQIDDGAQRGPCLVRRISLDVALDEEGLATLIDGAAALPGVSIDDLRCRIAADAKTTCSLRLRSAVASLPTGEGRA